MLTKLSKIMTKVTEFTNKHNVAMEFHLYKVGELKNESENQASNWATFEKSAGLFCIFGDDSNDLKNIRKNTKAIGGALHKILYKDEKAQTEITDNNMILVIMMKQEAYMASSLKNYINKMAL
jgi:hypothetical protein